jgi:predicted nucleotidyltransferase
VYKFFDKYNLGAPFIYIHPYKQLAAKKIADNAPENLDYIIIFGSAVTHACRSDSDMDVCLVGREAEDVNTGALRLTGQPYDFLYYPSVEDLIEKSKINKFGVSSDILRDGVIVYAGKNNALSKSES